MRQTNQQFTKGINERFPEERQTPERLSKLQNARLFRRGNGQFVSRIEGFEEWLSYEGSDYATTLDNESKEGKHDVSGYQKGYRIRLSDSFEVEEENNLGGFFGNDNKNKVSLNDIFLVKINLAPRFIEPLTVGETFIVRRILLLSFVDGLQIEDFLITGNRFTLSFTEAVDVIDRDLSCLE